MQVSLSEFKQSIIINSFLESNNLFKYDPNEKAKKVLQECKLDSKSIENLCKDTGTYRIEISLE